MITLQIIIYELKVLDGDFIINFYYKNEINKFFELKIPRNSTNEEKRNIVIQTFEESDTIQDKIIEIKDDIENTTPLYI